MERMDKERRTPESEENEKDSNLKEIVTDICVVKEIVAEDNTDFALTTFLRSVNQALKDGIVGVMERARSVACTVMNWCWGMIRVLLTDGVPWILRQLFSAIKFVLGRRMRRLIWENIMLVILAPLFLIALMGPLCVYFWSHSECWFWGGIVWILSIGCAGTWIGIRKGAFSRLLKRWGDGSESDEANGELHTDDCPEAQFDTPSRSESELVFDKTDGR